MMTAELFTTQTDKRDALIAHYTDEDGVFHALRAVAEFREVFRVFGGYRLADCADRRAELALACGIAIGASGGCDDLARQSLASALVWAVRAAPCEDER